MNLKKILYSALAGGSLAMGGRWVYRRRRNRLKIKRRRSQRMQWIIRESIARLGKISSGRVPVQQAYFFVWIVEKVCARHGIDCPAFDFQVKEGMLFSSELTGILRRMIKKGVLGLEGHHLLPAKDGSEPPSDETGRRVLQVIKETATQWKSDFPDEPLVRFGQLFR